MSRFSVRSTREEIMDDLTCSGEVVDQTLRELDFINQWLGGNQVTLNGLNVLVKKWGRTGTLHIADLGCGSGEMLKLIHRKFGEVYPKIQLTGIDANPNIIAFAEKHCADVPAIQFKTENIFDVAFQKNAYDILIATLFLHHFSHHQLVALFRTLKKQVRVGIVINDLHRHPAAYYSIRALTRLFSKSAMVKYDAPLSVLRGFTRKEWDLILKEAGITHYALQWKWAFRWQVIITMPGSA